MKASFPATPLPIFDPFKGFCTSPLGPWKEKAWAGAQSQEGPLGKMTTHPWGQAYKACSRQEFSGLEILRARNNCLSATAQLPEA